MKPGLIYDVESEEAVKLIKECIKKYGFASEHTYTYFMTYKHDKSRPVFFYFGDHKGVFAVDDADGSWQMISEPLAPKDEIAAVTFEFLKKVSENPEFNDIYVEFPPELRKSVSDMLKMDPVIEKKIKMGTVRHKFIDPLMNIQSWDPELKSPEMSKLRKAKSRFFRNFDVKLIKDRDLLSIKYAEYEALVHEWRKNRRCKDFAYYREYLAFFRNLLDGKESCNAALAIRLNGKLCGVAAGWEFPNNSKKVYYAINLHNYSVSEIGDFLTVLFFDELRSKGYEILDFGNSDEPLLKYKRKFGEPFELHDILCFYIKKKKADL